jgi:hypothetical protein
MEESERCLAAVDAAIKRGVADVRPNFDTIVLKRLRFQ